MLLLCWASPFLACSVYAAQAGDLGDRSCSRGWNSADGCACRAQDGAPALARLAAGPGRRPDHRDRWARPAWRVLAAPTRTLWNTPDRCTHSGSAKTNNLQAVNGKIA